MSDTPDPRFLGGNEGLVLTDAAQMRWVIAVGHDGAADVYANIDRPTMAAELRFIADSLDPDTDEST